MIEDTTFAIRRSDDLWYVEDGPDGTGVWDSDLENARSYPGYVEAMRDAARLQQAGHAVRVLAVMR